jgi:hypothetical protein
MGVALSAASSFKNSLFHLSLSSVFTLCCSVFSFLGRPNIPHNTHSASRRKVLIRNKKKKEEEEETEEEVKEEEEETEEK